MKIIGITGGVGCGKSTVIENIQKNYNTYVISADDVAKKLMMSGQTAFNKVVEIFGDGILDKDGEIDRKKLGDIVFNNKNKLMVLNSITHPEVKKAIVADITSRRIKEDYELVLVECALFLEEHYNVFCDEVWYIYSDREVRVNRLMTGRGYTREKTESMMNNQLTDEEYKNGCDVVIDNSNGIDATMLQIKKILDNN